MGRTISITNPPQTAEFALMAACVVAAVDPARDTLDNVVTTNIDWWCFADLVERHRIGGIVWRALARSDIAIDTAAAALLADKARTIAGAALASVGECRRIDAAFAHAGITLLFAKGLVLGALAYGDPFAKMSADIDLYVSLDDVGRAAALLETLGYQCTTPSGASIERVVRWHRRRKESVWTASGRAGTAIDLHSAFVDQPQLLGSLPSGASRRVTIVGDLSLPTLSSNETFAYLCVHGASSAWFRLKWIADLYALHYRDPPPELARLYDQALVLGAGRAAGCALWLAAELFGLDLGTALRARIESVATHRWLAMIALRQLYGGEPTARRLGTLSIHASQLLLLPGPRYKIAEAARQLRLALWRG